MTSPRECEREERLDRALLMAVGRREREGGGGGVGYKRVNIRVYVSGNLHASKGAELICNEVLRSVMYMYKLIIWSCDVKSASTCQHEV